MNQRFFQNNINNFKNGNPRFNNRQQPHQFQPRPPPFNHHQQQFQNAPPASNNSANHFIPLQASRKATKAKNLQQPKQIATNPIIPKEVQQESSPVVASIPKIIGKSPAVETRKSRLAINFAAK